MNISGLKKSSETTVDYRTCVYPVPYVPLKIDVAQPVDGGVKELLKHIRPEWPTESIQLKTFTDGYTNKLIRCSVNPDDVVLVRIYGKKSELTINREREIKAVVVLHSNDCAAPIFCRFENGLVYGFVAGTMVNLDLAQKPTVQRLIAQHLARLQSIDVAAAAAEFADDVCIDTSPSMFKLLYSFVDLCPFDSTDPQKQASVSVLPLSREQLIKEIDQLHDILPTLGSPVVFCHNDFLLQNVIYDANARFEKLDFSLYPDRECQLRWLRNFLEFNYKESGQSASSMTDKDVERLFVQVNKFALGVCLYNALWGLVQIQHSDLDFDFSRYIRLWLEQYCTWKEKFLSLEMP